MVLCKAYVEIIKAPTPHRPGDFEVVVMGEEPHDYVRTYRIKAKNDSMAAREGIDRFVAEISDLVAGADK